MYLYAGVKDILTLELYAALNFGVLRVRKLVASRVREYMHACMNDDS